MTIIHRVCAATVSTIIAASSAVATDACATTQIRARASVTASDGATYGVETLFQSKNAAATLIHAETTQRVVVEGPFSWTSGDAPAALGDDALKAFALGHQVHALLLHFDDVMANIRPSDAIDFRGAPASARSGDFPFGGSAHLILSGDASKPAGLRLDLPDAPVIEILFDDWRGADGAEVPFHVVFDDQSRTFEYRYDEISLHTGSPLWFVDAVEAPPLDQVRIYRLHRRLLAAHCMGDAALMAQLMGPSAIIADNGALSEVSPEDVQARFADVFSRVDYTAYRDLSEPIIEVSESGDLGWAVVTVRSDTTTLASVGPMGVDHARHSSRWRLARCRYLGQHPE